jgi:hypothetical protein
VLTAFLVGADVVAPKGGELRWTADALGSCGI